ncbi:MAG: class I SAM-dependent methyltransferase [Erysipelotrichaceae bacterium]|nr:class I SAM-dependent methyltransferase [Erysipelotrichaceae bacterium]
MINKTLQYYDEHAVDFTNSTVNVDFKKTQDHFLNFIKPNGLILDFGCGSGRDTKYFLSQGYQVDAIDGSQELCQIASEYTGIKVKQMLFQELDDCNIYDGIWACSSILHLSKSELKDVFHKMALALKDDGSIYTSFKYGTFEGERHGRYFTDFTLETFQSFLDNQTDLKLSDYWITGDVRANRGDEKWLNVILQKQ